MEENYRIQQLRLYLLTIIDTLTHSSNSQINADMLSNDINNYSLDKIPTEIPVEVWITGDEIHRDVYSFRSRMSYSQDTLNNLKNIGFYEKFERIIKNNNLERNLPLIDGIESIECLNHGTMINNETSTAEFEIQIQITYRDTLTDSPVSM